MELSGQHSDPPRPLEALLEGRWDDRIERAGANDRPDGGAAEEADSPIGSRHRRHDWVLEAVLRVLAERKEPMGARDVHGAVEAFLGSRFGGGRSRGARMCPASGRGSPGWPTVVRREHRDDRRRRYRSRSEAGVSRPHWERSDLIRTRRRLVGCTGASYRWKAGSTGSSPVFAAGRSTSMSQGAAARASRRPACIRPLNWRTPSRSARPLAAACDE